MPLITKPDFTYVWASGGAIVAPNDTKKQLGWVAEAPPFQWDNWLQNRQDQMLAHINQRGIPAWDGLTNYEAGGLSYVQGSDGKIYKSVAASGPSATAQNPTTDVSDTYWTVAFADVGAFLTQAAGDLRYAQRANNLSDLTNASTARTNLGVANAVMAGISGSYSNLKASATGTNATVTITADSVCVKDSSNNQVVLNSVSISPSLSTGGANGLDTGTSTTSTWYYLWVIWNGTTVAGLLSLSSTSPTMPSGYTHKARVGSTRSDGTGNKYPLRFVQYGRRVRWGIAAGSNQTAYPLMSSGVVGSISPITWSAIATGAFCPPTTASISVTAQNPNVASSVVLLGANNVPSGTWNTTTPLSPAVLYQSSVGSGSAYGATCANVDVVLESSNIYWIANAAAAGLNAIGYEDNL